ncbi:hypothetical protein E2C01_054295 [Portunus trituberculatus]|uniref:Tyr recombinase domain-containing protein n=1 Tax=Portunus trituberculatus TaxID=210409 RepID=A0A5B7GRL0_PORTR|nr:hypothetical protein [Portunus trituberculatus]
MLSALRPSSTRQYESCWRAFQAFLRERGAPSVTAAVVFSFLSSLVHERGRQPPTVAVHLVALSDPLWYGFNIRLDPRAVVLLKRGLFYQRPPLRAPRPTWSLQKVLDILRGGAFFSSPLSLVPALKKALFLTALASGLRASQLRALTRFPQWTVFVEDRSHVSLAPSPRFLTKNEREDHRLQLVVIPAWMDHGEHHSLCPVAALKYFIKASSDQPPHCLFVSERGSPLSTRRISALLHELIEEADPGRAPKAHDIRGAAYSLAFLRTFSLAGVTEGGQWSSSTSFVTRYLSHSWRDIPCVALGVLPGNQSSP